MALYDLIIVGAGPAGSAAGVYAARKKLKTLMIAESFGGQSVVSEEIQNWIGTKAISGEDLAKNLKSHVEAYAGDSVEIKEGSRVEKVSRGEGIFNVTTNKGETFETKTILIATGGSRKKLQAKGADVYENKGITYCASCDGPLFADRDTVVIGGGNAGFETAAQLLSYAKSVTLLQHGDEFKADPITVKKVLSNPKMKAVLNANTLEIVGDKFVTGLIYEDTMSHEKNEIKTDGIFVEIGLVPATGMVENVVEMTPFKQIVVDHKNQKASVAGIWAAGDCTNALYHQNNIAVGDAVKAVEDIYMFLNAK